MNAFEIGRSIERRSRDILEPLLEQTTCGRFVYTDKGRLAKEFQKKIGDVLIQEAKDGGMWTIEMKAEDMESPNLFLEFWSNGSRYTVGWMFHLESDLLFYHFISADKLYIIKLDKLKRWFFFGESYHGQVQPGYQRFPLKRQKKHDQLNDTWGICVPVQVIQKEVGLRLVNPLGLDFNSGIAA